MTISNSTDRDGIARAVDALDDPGEQRAGFYPRVSRSGKRTRADLERHTLKQQRELAVNCLPRRVAFIEDERYVDTNVSGMHSARPGLEALFADVESGAINAVVVGYLSRFGRNAKEALENLQRLLDADATLYIAREGLVVRPKSQRQTGDMSEIIYTIFAAFAQLEAERLADGLADANATAIADGVSITIPYGYVRSDGPGSVLVADELDDFGPAPAAVVRRIFALRLEGWGSTGIARLLNDERVPSPTRHAAHRGRRVKQIGERWQPMSVTHVFETHTYRGVIPRWQTELTGVGKRRRRIRDTLELLPGAHDALIDEPTFRAAQSTIAPPTPIDMGGALLQTLVRCATCSQTMSPSSGKSAALIYKCRGRKAGCDRPAIITRRHVDEYVETQVLKRAGNGGLGVVVADTRALDTLDAKVSDHAEELAAFRDGGDARDPDYWPGVRARRKRLVELERQRAELNRELASNPFPTPDVYRTLSVDERREVLSATLDCVVIAPAEGRGRMGRMDERVVAIVPAGRCPIELGGRGRPMPPRRFPVELVEAH
jgi:DNA invertase Pin-like site-specific DNA recombinase